MNIMVTGGLGVGGAWLARQLIQEGHRPVIFDNGRDTSLISDILEKVEIVNGDLLDISSIIRTLKQYQIKTVAHLASLMTAAAELNPMAGFNVNAGGTVNVLEAARIMEVERVVFTSSKLALSPCVGEHGYPNYKPVDESHPAYPNTVYGITQVASEVMGNVYSENYGFDFIALRFASVYAPGRTARHGHRPMHGHGGSLRRDMTANAMLGIPTVVPVGGDEKDDMTYIKDFANAVVLACFAKNVRHRLFHIGTGRGYRYGEFADSIKKIYPDAVIEIGPGVWDEHGMPSVMDISRAQEELGFVPKFTLDEAVKDYIEISKLSSHQPSSGSVSQSIR